MRVRVGLDDDDDADERGKDGWTKDEEGCSFTSVSVVKIERVNEVGRLRGWGLTSVVCVEMSSNAIARQQAQQQQSENEMVLKVSECFLREASVQTC